MAKAKAWTLADVAKTFRACESLFHALGDPARQKIVLLLAEHDRLNVNQITELMHLARPSISHHLKVLKDAWHGEFDRRVTGKLLQFALG